MKVFATWVNESDDDMKKGSKYLIEIDNADEGEYLTALTVFIGDMMEFKYNTYEELIYDWSFLNEKIG